MKEGGSRNVVEQGADDFGEHGEWAEEEGLNGSGRIFRRGGGGKKYWTGENHVYDIILHRDMISLQLLRLITSK